MHPTQLYEVAWLLPRGRGALGCAETKSPWLIGEYLMAKRRSAGIVIEHWRVNERVALGLTEPQWIGILLIVVFGALGLDLSLAQKAAGAEASGERA